MEGQLQNSQENKKALFVLAGEFTAVIILIAGILTAFNYYGILPLSKISPLLSFLPTKEKASTGKNFTGVDPNLAAQTPVPPKVNYDPKAKPTVEAISDIPDYVLALQNKEKLMELLNSWGTFEKEYTPRYGATGATGKYPLKKIVIHLVDTEQETNAFGRSPQDIYSSSLTKISPGRFDVYVYVEKPMLENQAKNFKPGSVFRATLLSSLYKVTHPYSNKAEADRVRDDLYKAFKENSLMQVDYFIIEKK